MPRQSLENIRSGSIEGLPTGNAFHKSAENCLARSGKWRLPRTARYPDLLSPRRIQLAKSNRIPSLKGLVSALHLDQLYRNLECDVDLLVYRLRGGHGRSAAIADLWVILFRIIDTYFRRIDSDHLKKKHLGRLRKCHRYAQTVRTCVSMMPSFLKFKMAFCEKGISESPRHGLSKRLFFALALFLLATLSTLAQSSISVNVSPKPGGLTIGQTLSITATVSNDSLNQGVTWNATGGSFSLTATASGAPTAYTAPATAGVYTLTATSISDVTKSANVTFGVTDLAGVFTYHNNLSRDGSNPKEYALTPSNVSSATFGKLFSCTVDGAIYAQPLWAANLTINGVQRNVVFVATQHESLYAFDADVNTSPCTPLWQVSLIDNAHGGSNLETSVPSGPAGHLVGGGYGDITPEVGVTGTPVIDPSSNTLYVVSKSVIPSGPTFYQRLHAVDLTTGNEKSGGPVTIAGTYPGTGDGGTTVTFNPRQQNQRPGLVLVNGIVYIAWASHEDAPPYYGWVMGYNASTLTQASVLNVTPNVHYGGIWMGGGAPAADSSNNLYLITGNGIFDLTNTTGPTNDYGDSFLKLTSSLSVSQYFTPSDQANDNANDADFGSGGAAILVDQPSGPVQHLVIGGGKDGYLYLLNRA